MRSDRKVFVNSVFYTINGMLQNCFSFFLLPLYTAYLSTSDYGTVSIAENFLAVMSYLCAFSMYTAVSRFYVEYKDNQTKLKRFYGTVSVFVMISALVYATFFCVFRNSVTALIFSGAQFFPVVFVCLIEIIFHCQRVIYESILQSQQKAFAYSVISFTLFVIKISLTVFFVVFKKSGALGIILAGAVHNFLFFSVFMTDMIKHHSITFCFDKALLKTTLKYSIPIMPHNLSTHIANLFSKILIGASVSLGAVGVFSIATKFGEVADVIQNYVNNAYGPWLYEKLHNGEDGYKNTIRSTVNLMVAAIGFCCLCLALFSQEVIVLVIDSAYTEAWRYIPFIVGIYIIKITYYFYVSVLFYYKQASKRLFTATLTSSVVNVLIAAFLIPKYGVFGSIISDGISMAIRIGIVVYISSKFENIGLKVTDFIIQEIVIICFIVLGMIFTLVSGTGAFSWKNIIFKFAVCILYAVCYLFFFRKSIKKLLNVKSYHSKI